jgi:hypothetical protein
VTSYAGARVMALAAVALLAGLAAVALIESGSSSDGNAAASVETTWNVALAGSRGPAGDAQRTTCGQVLAATSLGITHPALPCGAKLVVRHGGAQVLSEVVDNLLVEPGRQLELTDALAKRLGLTGTQEVEWRFATTP